MHDTCGGCASEVYRIYEGVKKMAFTKLTEDIA